MKIFVLLFLWPGMIQAVSTEDYDFVTDDSNVTEYPSFVYINDTSEEIPGKIQDVRLDHYKTSSNLRVYKGPLPIFPGTTMNPWIALHSPIKMYIPIRNTGENSPESTDCIQCPRNLIIQLPPTQQYIRMPVPTISLCSSFAHQSGRVHVAVISGPRPGQRLTLGRYEVELVVWKAEGLVHSCTYIILVRGTRRGSTPTKFYVQKVPCLKPEQPSNGLLLCVPSDKKYYPHNSVCQFFCLNNYLVKDTTTNSSIIVCKNGRWSPHDRISCVATFCPKPLRPPMHGSWNCNAEVSGAGFRDGTQCNISCAPDFVVETSQIENAVIRCIPPTWKTLEVVPDCKKAHLPKLQQCQDRNLIVRTGQAVKILDQLLPKGTSHAGVVLSPVCILQQKNLSKGKHQNVCEVTDPELRTKRKCSYFIHIEESSGPRPHADDCKNRTIPSNRKGTIHSKPVRFLIKTGKPSRTQVIRGNCTPRGELPIGSHFIVCKAINPHTGSIETCSYWLTVKQRTCPPLRPIPNGRILCASRIVGAVCRYDCNTGYYLPDNELIRAIKTCEQNQRWQPAWYPTCKIESPTLEEGCVDLEVNMSFPIHFAVPQPKFLSALNETLNTSCTPSILNSTGRHQIGCEIEDDVFNASCHFNISILLEDIPTTTFLPEAESPTLVEGCEDMEVDAFFPIYFIVPAPRFLTAQNETMNVSCIPNLITNPGIHQINCIAPDNIFNESCVFNVTVYSKDGQTTMTSTEKVQSPELLEGCNNMEMYVTSSFNFTIPVPQYLTFQNETLRASCEPSFITTAGQYEVKCFVDNEKLIEFCYFNVSLLEGDLITVPSAQETESPKLIEGCSDLEVNVSSPVNFTIPLPQYLTSQNETLVSSCEPAFITAVGPHEVQCWIDNAIDNEFCYFNVTVLLEDVPVPSIEEVESPELMESCSDLDLKVSSLINISVPLPQYLTSQNRTLFNSCEPSLITAVGQHRVKCLIDNLTPKKFCSFNLTVLLQDELTTFSYPEKVERPKLAKGCNDLEVNVSPPFNFTIPSPRYLTPENKTLIASCQPVFITVIGHYRVKCSIGNATLGEFCYFNVTVSREETDMTPAPETDFCKPLTPPLNGSVQCSSRGQIETCLVSCDPGYGFSDDYSFTVVCDASLDGIWDFQRSDVNGTLPECFAQVEGSAVEVWISFEAFAPHCEEELEEQMKDIISELCQLDADCSKFILNCTLDEESDMMLVILNWTVQADFNTDEYISHEEIPEAETRLEAVLKRTRTFLATEDAPDGLHLFRDSFRRGHLTLVCPNGFAPDMMMANCVQCPMENSHC